MQALTFILVASFAVQSCFAAAFISCTRALGEDSLFDKVAEGRLDILSTCLAENDYLVDDPALFYHACTSGHDLLLEILISDPNYIDNILDGGHLNFGNFALRQALHNGHQKIAQHLLCLYEEEVIPLDVDFNSNEFAVYAAATGQLEFLEDLLEYDDVDPDDRNGTALVQAILNGHTEVALLLIDDSRVYVGRAHNTALAAAVQVKNKSLISVLLERYEVRTDCVSSMFVAALNGDVEILEMFLNDDRIEFSSSAITRTFLSANASGNTDVVKALLFDFRLNRRLLLLIAEENPDSFLASEYGQFLIFCVMGDYKRAAELCPTEIDAKDLARLKEHNPFLREFLENRNFI